MSGDLSLAIEEIQSTLTEFRSDCDQWENELGNLLDDLLVPPDTQCTQAALDEVKEMMAQQLLDSAERQTLMSDELGTVHVLVERQVELLSALVGASAQPPGDGTSSVSEGHHGTADSVLAQIEHLKQLAGVNDADS